MLISRSTMYCANINRVFVLFIQLLQVCLRQLTSGLQHTHWENERSNFSRSKESFRYIDRKILLSNLDYYSISYNSFKSYLENHTQQCSVGESLSDSRVLTYGVPQGTILGPLLLLLYMNRGRMPMTRISRMWIIM